MRFLGFRRFDPAASAAALALMLVVWGVELHPHFPAGSWLDASLNQWLICFAALYIAFVVLQAAIERFAPGRRRD